MNYLKEYSDARTVLPLLEELKHHASVRSSYRIMEFCGGHTHTLFKSGLIDLLPKQIEMIHGPGCPVCVLPAGLITQLIRLLENNPDVILATYADVMRIPNRKRETLAIAKSRGHDIRSVYSPMDALKLACENKHRRIIFFAIGFETTIPATLLALKKAIALGLDNFYIYCNHLNTTQALIHLLEKEKNNERTLDGLIGPGHVSLVVGARFFGQFSRTYHKPIVISGFTPFDLAKSILMLVKQINENRSETEIEYTRAVTDDGNQIALNLINQFLTLRKTFEWRGLGELESSAFQLKPEFKQWDVEEVFDLRQDYHEKEHSACLCPQILTATQTPLQCKLFGTHCTPQTPYGPCMVSSEGACSAYYAAGRHLEMHRTSSVQ